MGRGTTSNPSGPADQDVPAPEVNDATKDDRPRKRRRLPRWLRAWGWLVFVLLSLFTLNGLWLAHGERVVIGEVIGEVSPENLAPPPRPANHVKVMSWNIAKCFAHEGGLSFADEADVRERLRQMGDLIQQEQPDLVFLSETLFDCSPCSVNQVVELAKASGLKHWAFGENYNFGLPFYRVSGGNAILSRFPLAPLGNPNLPGRKPFWVTKNNRRALWCAAAIGGKTIRLCSVHNDSFDIENNRIQTMALIAFPGDSAALFAGDFNARRDQPPIEILETALLPVTGADGTPTFPPKSEEIDFIFAPRAWKVVSYRVIENDVSDHRPVVAVFETN